MKITISEASRASNLHRHGESEVDRERQWHDPSFVLPRQRRRNLRRARSRRLRTQVETNYESAERQADLERERSALGRQVNTKCKGDPSRSVPLAFDEQGEFLAPLDGRMSDRRKRQAKLLLEFGLIGKARRQAWCGLIGRKRDCFSGDAGHKFYSVCRCGNRYCPDCGPSAFRRLFTRHGRLRTLVEEWKQRPNYILAKLDITRRNTGEMPSPVSVRCFNENIKQLREAIRQHIRLSRRQFGILYCDEFGSGNTNLHAHGIYLGPWISQKVLTRLWAQICHDGSFIISIKRAKSFEAALAHALKYPSKFFEASPGRLAELELAFHKVRRVHALGLFYNPKIERESGEEGPMQAGRCPVCGDLLLDAQGWHFVEDLRREGRRETDAARIEMARTRIIGGVGPP